MRINCPYCGERSLDEYAYHGDASVTRPDMNTPDAVRDFTTYVFDRDNPAGPHQELWYHAAGCHAWLVVTRVTTTHEIISVEPARDIALKRSRAGKGSI